ncbi:MAG: DUF934 domain-containing protein [Rhodobacteraceae bacterium]|nr:DUF934 domain-containing protein [Paracoccaceae bacterium]
MPVNSCNGDLVIVRDDGFRKDDLADCEHLTVEAELQGVESPVFLEISNDQDPDILIPSFCWLSAISIRFPDFVDGRGFSLAARLRQLGYTGRLRATGSLIADQYRLARQSGFDEVAISRRLAARQTEHQWLAQMDRVAMSYQSRLLKTTGPITEKPTGLRACLPGGIRGG